MKKFETFGPPPGFGRPKGESEAQQNEMQDLQDREDAIKEKLGKLQHEGMVANSAVSDFEQEFDTAREEGKDDPEKRREAMEDVLKRYEEEYKQRI